MDILETDKGLLNWNFVVRIERKNEKIIVSYQCGETIDTAETTDEALERFERGMSQMI